jgi:hypothetical protein
MTMIVSGGMNCRICALASASAVFIAASLLDITSEPLPEPFVARFDRADESPAHAAWTYTGDESRRL